MDDCENSIHEFNKEIRGGTISQIVRYLVANPEDQKAFFYGYGISKIPTNEICSTILNLFRQCNVPQQQNELVKLIVFWLGDILLRHDPFSINRHMLTDIINIVNESARPLIDDVQTLQLLLIRAQKVIWMREDSLKKPTISKITTSKKSIDIIHDYSVSQVTEAVIHMWTLNFSYTHISSFYNPSNNELTWYSDLFNHLAAWVTQTILESPLKKQSGALKFFLNLAKQLRVNNDFQGMFAIVAGLNHGALQRIDSLWSALSTKNSLLMKELTLLCSPSQQFKSYRQFVQTRKGPFIPYIGIYLSEIMHISELKRFIDPWVNELYNLNRIFEAGRQLVIFFSQITNFNKQRMNQCAKSCAKSVNDEMETLCSLIFYTPIQPETVFYFQSMSNKPLRPTFQWNLSSWHPSKIKKWCESECCISDPEKINQIVTALQNNAYLNSKILQEAGIESFLDRRALLKAQTTEMTQYAESLANKPLCDWSNDNVCFWVHLKEYPKSILDTIYSAGWSGYSLSNLNLIDEKMLQLELGVSNVLLCQSLVLNLEQLRLLGRLTDEQLKIFIATWSEIEFAEKVAYRKNCFAQNSNYSLLSSSGASTSRLSFSRSPVKKNESAKDTNHKEFHKGYPTRRTNSDGEVQISKHISARASFCDSEKERSSSVSFPLSTTPKQDDDSMCDLSTNERK